jgi:hypothetical protein
MVAMPCFDAKQWFRKTSSEASSGLALGGNKSIGDNTSLEIILLSYGGSSKETAGSIHDLKGHFQVIFKQ